MKGAIKKRTMVVAILAGILAVQANASARSKAIVVEFFSDLPELARGRSEAMYLQHTGMDKRFGSLKRSRVKSWQSLM